MISNKNIEYKPPSGLVDLDRLASPEGALYASGGEMYRSMLFGRDSLESADDLVQVRPDISESVIARLGQLQGCESNDTNAEEVGKIPHQHMQLFADGKRIPDSAEKQLHDLSSRWGGSEDGFTYYGSLDATPLYARLIARHCFIHGSGVLDRPIQKKNGELSSVGESFVASLEWVTDHLESSELSLLEFRRLSDQHIIFQSWRDSGTGFIHEDGSQVNVDGFIAPLEVQGYAYDALKIASELARAKRLPVAPNLAEKWQHHAEALRQNVIEQFWIPEKGQFAMGIDRSGDWQPRQIKTSASSQGVLLDSRLLLDLPESERQFYVEAIAKTMMSQDYLTDIGVRCRAAKDAHIVPFADYHGSQVVWAKETYDVAKGFARQGLDAFAYDLKKRILNMINVAGSHYEFLYVTPEGNVDYFPKKLTSVGNKDTLDGIFIATNLPDKGQAWTVSAALGIKHNITPKHAALDNTWAKTLQRAILDTITQAEPLNTLEQIQEKRMKAKNFAIDIEAGIAADRAWNSSWWA